MPHGLENDVKSTATVWMIVGLGLGTLASALDAQETRLIEVGGQELNVYTAGWEHLETGRPVVVFEGGATTPIQTWTAVLLRIAEHSPVVAYDPPGLGLSPWAEHVPTLEVLNTRLHELLTVIEAPAPYVLVAHSWASWAVRGYSGRYPDEVAGLVLIDPTPPESEFVAAFEALGIGPSGPRDFRQMLQAMMEGAPAPVRAQQAVINQYSEVGLDPDVPASPSVPAAVLVAGRFSDPGVPEDLVPFDLEAFLAELRTRQIMAPIPWVRASPAGTLVLANESSHCIQCDDPELVAWAIDRVLVAIPQSDPGALIQIRVVRDEAAPDAEPFEFEGDTLYLERTPVFSDEDFVGVESFVLPGELWVQLHLTPEAGARASSVTSAEIGGRLAVVVEGDVLYTPVVRDAVGGPRAQLVVSVSEEDFDRLAALIRARWPDAP